MASGVSAGGELTIASAGPGDERAVPDFESKRLLRHPLPVALVCLVLATLTFSIYPAGAEAAIAAFMVVVLVVVTATDLERRIIPNRVILPATGIVLIARVAVSPSPEWILAGLGAALVLVLPNLINASAIGIGDVKLALFLGVGLGAAVVGALTLAFLSILPVALAVLIRGGWAARTTALPFGPFLALGGLLILIVPQLVGT